jgi:hypothetical protein
VRQATEWFNKYEGEHTIERFLTGKRANDLDNMATNPHKKSSVAMELTPQSEETFVKVTGNGKKPGGFLADPDKLRKLDSRSEVMDKLALKEDWGKYNQVSAVKISSETPTKLRISKTSEVTDETVDGAPVTREGDFTQYQIEGQDIPRDKWYWPGSGGQPTHLDEWLN